MKRTAHFLAPLATRLAVLTFALTAVLATPVTAKPNAVRNNVGRSAPQRPAARPNNMSRPNMNRPNTASRPNATRPNTASRPNTTRPNATQSRPTQSNTAHANNTARPNATAGNAGHGATARNGQATNLHGGRQIADARFHASFGSSHQFHIGHPIMIGGQASFQFGGLWFGIVDPWPAAWLYTDAVYVDFVAGGYFLVNVLHPGVLVAVAVGDAVVAPAAPVVPVCVPTVAPAPAVPVSSIRWLGETSEPAVVS